MVRSQFVPTDKQGIHNRGGGGFENAAVCLGITQRNRRSPCHATDRDLFLSAISSLTIPPDLRLRPWFWGRQEAQRRTVPSEPRRRIS